MQQLTNLGSTMRIPGSYKRTLVLLAILLSSAAVMCSCSKSLVRQAKERRDEQQAQAQLKKAMDSKTLEQNWNATQARQSAQQNAREVVTVLEKDQQNAPPADPALAQAARQRPWNSIPVSGFNVNVVLYTSWQDGYLNYRVAILGERNAIKGFLSSYTRYDAYLLNQDGNNVLSFPMSPQGFSFRPDSYNQGTPTADTVGRTECPLNAYQQAVTWNLSWSF
jgi:hypothetical protein